ncbi:MAG: 23S rRNA (pseudouridine(1915)-N(3))-methyltransferase RlmH [Deltaproteobacteria bacterium]|nr:23S rRNA (pseudouridine(1915)-N(3))-methyltransferase RlmH [Deltaproteobacteria bacterium]
MLKIKFLVVDRTRAKFLSDGEVTYLDRLKKYARVEWIEVKPAKIKKGRPKKDIIAEEALAITKKLVPHDYLVALDPLGREYDSEGFSFWLEKLSTSQRGWINFIIGGPLGLSRGIIDQADDVLSLSRLTFTHEMCRLFLIEQIYRAFTIMKGTKYHK